MGSCVSSMHKRAPESAMKLGMSSFDSKSQSLGVLPPSPIKEKPPNGHPPVSDWSTNGCRDLGSKEETFFDSQPWLDSDCDDDFYSVNGDFTPSRGNTPVHRSFPTGTPQVNKTPLVGRAPASIPEPSPTGKKMKLLELFQQSIREGPEDQDFDKQYTSGSQNKANGSMEVRPTILALPPKSANVTPYVSLANSLCGSERTANEDPIMNEKPMRSVQCCLPTLGSCRSFGDRKKKSSPAVAANG